MPKPELTILLDGECPLCRREGNLLRWLDNGRGALVIEDISKPDFDPGEYGKTMDELMGEIHGVLPTGTLINGVAVFRRAYDAVGLGWLLAPTAWPVLRPVADAAYRLFARNRQWLTGRTGACEQRRCRTG